MGQLIVGRFPEGMPEGVAHERVNPLDGWWKRDTDGQLWVWAAPTCDAAPRWMRTPLPPARIVHNQHTAAQGIRDLPDTPVERKRITMALDFRGMWGPEVDEALGVAEPLVDWWEEGRVEPTHDEVRRLATLTMFAPWWFYQGPVPELTTVFMCTR